MEFNSDKCEEIKIGTYTDNATCKLSNIAVDIINRQCERDIGVLVSSDLILKSNV